MTAKDYAALAVQIEEAAFRLKPADQSPTTQTATLAIACLQLAAHEIQRLAEWTADQEDQEPKWS